MKVSKAGVRPLLMALAVPLSLASAVGANSGPLLVGLVALCFIASGVGAESAAFLILGAGLINAPASLLPPAVILLAAMLLGALLRVALVRTHLLPGFWPSGVLALFMIMMVMVRPSMSPAGAAAAAALTLLPLSMCTGLLSLCGTDALRATVSFLIGLQMSVGAALYEVWRQVSAVGYATYSQVRVFESSIGSSNYAAGLAAGVGVFALTVGLQEYLPKFRWIIVMSSVPFILAPLFLLSRGASLAAFVGVIVALRAGSKSRMTYGVAVGAAAVVGFWVARNVGLIDRLSVADGVGTDLTAGRVDLWNESYRVIVSNPLTGLGPGGLADNLMSVFAIAYPHNVVIAVLGQLGLIVGSLYLWICVFRPLFLWGWLSPAILTLVLDSMIEPMIDTLAVAPVFGVMAALHLVRADKQCDVGQTPIQTEPVRGVAQSPFGTCPAEWTSRASAGPQRT